MAERSGGPETNANRPTEVAAFPHQHQAELARGFLEDAGIPAAVVGDAAGQIQYGAGFSSPARVLVRQADRHRALSILAAAGMVEGPGR